MTDLAALYKYVRDLSCDGDMKALIVISDFIVTKNEDMVDDEEKALLQANYEVSGLYHKLN